MKSMMKRNTFREIKKSFGRYFAILAIIALGFLPAGKALSRSNPRRIARESNAVCGQKDRSDGAQRL